MKQFEPQATERYLFNEMPEDEREKFEEAILADDDVFFDVATRENELVDLFSAGRLSGEDLERFERGLESLPARRQKIANARTLHQFIETQRPNKTITIAERTGSSSRLAELFSFRSPVVRFAAIAAILVLALAAAYLFYENRQLRSLQDELANAQRRAGELSTQIETERETAGELTADLDRERGRIADLEKQIASLRGSDRDKPPVNAGPPPTVATLVLGAGFRGGSAPPVKRLELPAGVNRLSVVINLPTETGEQVTVRLNGNMVAENVRVRIRNGEKSVSVVVPVTRIQDQRNSIEIIDSTGRRVIEYPFTSVTK